MSLEKIFFGWPYISVIAPNIITNPGELLQKTFYNSGKVKFFIENKIDYPKNIVEDNYLLNKGFNKKTLNNEFQTTILFNNQENIEPDIVICCY